MPLTPAAEGEVAFVDRLGRQLRTGAGDPSLIGEGSNNWVYRLGDRGDAIVLKLGKPHRADVTAAEHAKERWCAAAARAAGVATPEILALGSFEERPYQLQALAPGRLPTPAEHPRVWGALGAWARAIHGVPVSGWGPKLVRDGIFAEDWSRRVAYNIEALGADDPLRGLGVLDAASSLDLKARFERLGGRAFRFALTHADLSPRNVLVDDGAGGALALIDWGCAGAFAAPHHELNEILRTGSATPAEIDIFRRAYGLSDEAFPAVTADLPELAALREVDTLRWGLEHGRPDLGDLLVPAKRALVRLRAR